MEHFIGQTFNGTTVVGETQDSVWVAGNSGDWILERQDQIKGIIKLIQTEEVDGYKKHKISFRDDIYGQVYPDLVVWEYENKIELSHPKYLEFCGTRSNRRELESMPKLGDEIEFNEVISWRLPKDLRRAKSFEDMYHCGEPHDDTEDYDNTPYHKGDNLAY